MKTVSEALQRVTDARYMFEMLDVSSLTILREKSLASSYNGFSHRCTNMSVV